MSDPTYYTRLTDIGSAALNNAITGGDSIALTELALGDTNGASYDPDGSETTLVNEQYRLAISSIAPDAQNPAWLIVEAIIPPDVGGWWIREAGIFDANGDMFAIAKYPETYKAVLSDGTASTLTIQIVLQVTNTDSIELVVNPLDGYATQGWVVSAYPWATEAEAVNAQLENKLIDPKRLAYALSQLDMASSEDLISLSQTLDQDLSGKADADHNHDGRYALIGHNHNGTYATKAQFNDVSADLSSLSQSVTQGLSTKANVNHNHDSRYALIGHNHNSTYATKTALNAVSDDVETLQTAVDNAASVAASRVQSVRLGSEASTSVKIAGGVSLASGFVMTGVYQSSGNVSDIRYRPVQTRVNGTWYTVASL